MKKPTLQTILVSILIIVALFTSIYFPYKWKQLSNDFLDQTNQYGELLKQINDLQKEVRELKNGNVEVDELPDKNLEIEEPTFTEPEEIDTSDWKTYRNEEYGFEVKYPEDWELINLGDFNPGNTGVVLKSPNYKTIKDGNVMHEGEICIHGTDNQNNLSIEELVTTFNDASRFWFDKFDHTDININGNHGVLFDYIMENSPLPIPQSNIKSIEVYIQGDKKIINISYLFLENPKREIFDKILSTFKFIE